MTPKISRFIFYSDNYTVVEKGNFASALTWAARLSTPKKKIILEVKFDPKFWNLKQRTLKEREITQYQWVSDFLVSNWPSKITRTKLVFWKTTLIDLQILSGIVRVIPGTHSDLISKWTSWLSLFNSLILGRSQFSLLPYLSQKYLLPTCFKSGQKCFFCHG